MKKKLLLLAIGLTGMHVSAQVGIGTTPDEAAMLDVASTDKGILIPRISLSSTKHILNNSASSQPDGLFVYNTGDVLAEGFYFWDGAEWKSVESSSAVAPAISSLLCERASLEPSSFKAGQFYSGLLKVPYLGGNGGKYSAGTVYLSNSDRNLKIRLKPGRLEYGAGELVFDVEGTPSQSSPVEVKLPVVFAGKYCEATVGVEQNAVVASIATVGPLLYTLDNGFGGFHRSITSLDGKFSVRVFVPTGTALGNADIQIRTNKQPVTIMWNGLVSWQGGSKGTASNELSLPSTNVWYGNTSENSNTAASSKDAGWGDEDVYYLAPEQRTYMWSSTDVNDKTVYVLTFMMGAPSYLLSADVTNAAQTKAFLQIEQIEAN
jgi:hypothetical protein